MQLLMSVSCVLNTTLQICQITTLQISQIAASLVKFFRFVPTKSIGLIKWKLIIIWYVVEQWIRWLSDLASG